MFSYLYHTIVYDPIYNLFIIIFDAFPWIDAGLAVILLTIIVRFILFPLSKKAIITQVKMKEIEPKIHKIRKDFPDRQQQAMQMMELYKTSGVNPFSSFFLLFLQLPIIFALYSIFINSGFPDIKEELLYRFVSVPSSIDMTFLGLVNVAEKSILLALIAAVAQYLQLHFSLASAGSPVKSDNAAMDAAQNAVKNMKYIFPIVVFVIAYQISAAVAIYWAVSSLFTLGQELVVRRHIKRHEPI